MVHILHQVSQSLEEAHRLGMVHRDIKPRNILLGKLGLEYDFAKVLDFGLVKTRHNEDPERTATTMDGVTTGTPAYLSPEAALCSPHIDGRADLYSLGCTAYFLLTGCNVFDAKTPTACAMAHVQTPPPPMKERCDLPVPAELEAIVMKLLEKDPANRIQSAQDLARSLRALNQGLRMVSRAGRTVVGNQPPENGGADADRGRRGSGVDSHGTRRSRVKRGASEC